MKAMLMIILFSVGTSLKLQESAPSLNAPKEVQLAELRTNTKHMSDQLSSDNSKIRVAVVGSSITEGWGACDATAKNLMAQMVRKCPAWKRNCDCSWDQHSYPTVMGSALGDNYEVVNLATSCTTYMSELSGASTPYMETQSYSNLTVQSWDVIVFALGSNDFRNWLIHSSENCEDLSCNVAKDMLAFINGVKLLNPNAHLMVTSEFPVSDTKFAGEFYSVDSKGLKERGSRIFAGVTKKVGATFVPVNKWLGGWPPKASYYSHKDGFHLNIDGSKMLGEKIASMIRGVTIQKNPNEKKLTTFQAMSLPGIKDQCMRVDVGGSPYNAPNLAKAALEKGAK